MTATMLDDFLPQYQFAERHARQVAAQPASVWQALQTTRVAGSLLTRSAVALRMLPARFAGRPAVAQPLFDLQGMANFLRLGERAEHELVLGMVGHFWKPLGGLVRVAPEAFAAYESTDCAKLIWGFALEDRGGATVLRTETRVQAMSPAAMRRFRPYWYVIRPVSGLIRRDILAGIAVEAERLEDVRRDT